MAKINNQAVLQKLIDELKLYPGIDAIPTELAEKILPVYQINSEQLTISNTPANIVRDGNLTQAATSMNIFVVPPTGKFFLTSLGVSITTRGGGGVVNTDADISVTIDGVIRKVLVCGMIDTTGAVNGLWDSMTMTLANPILVDAGTNVTFNKSATMYEANATIIGYTESD